MKRREYFSQNLQTKKYEFLEKVVFLPFFHSDTMNAVSAPLPKKYQRKTENISHLVRKQSITSFSWKSCFPTSCFYEHLEWSVGKPIEKSLTKMRKFFAQFLKTIWKKTYFFLEKTFLLKVFVWSLGIQFWALRRKLVNRKPKLCRSKFEIDKKKHFFNDLFSEYVSMDNNAVLTTAPENYQQKAENILLNEQKRSKIQISERQFFPSRCFYKHLECSVDKRAEIFLTKRNIFA